jgi:anti-anti-sigma factor
MDLVTRHELVGTQRVIRVIGDVDLATLPRFSDVISRSAEMGPADGPLVVDLDEVLVLDDAALGLLLGAAGRQRASGGDLVVVCSNPTLRQRLALNGFDRAVRVVDHIGAAAQPPLEA